MSKTKMRRPIPAATATVAEHTPGVTSSVQLQPAILASGHSTIGLVVGIAKPSPADTSSTCWVTYPENPSAEAQVALVLSHVGAVLPGQSVLLQFVGARLTRPIVLGVVAGSDTTELQNTSQEMQLTPPDDLADIRVVLDNQEVLTLMATKQLVLRCGKASIVLNQDGSIEIRGTDLISRASGQNAIRGACVTLN
ncbi:DUF6484 domain-containing protein [Acidovorax sp. LjRoot117]|uniref:DUF6484 domain-containing protein n=1 Tax=Acidovorax sp. LjRoot117 TaxID=3342255 RepID=UPI003ED0CBF7